MTNKMIVILSFLFFSCKTNLRSTSCYETKYETKEDYIYWEDLTDTEKSNILNSNVINEKVIDYYNNKLILNDDQIMINLLDTLTQLNKNKEKIILYFYIFNQICSEADAAVSEGLGAYCQRMLLNYPLYIINYFNKNHSVKNTYANILGYEFYFKEEGTSMMEYNYAEFKEILKDSIEDTEKYRNVLKDFLLDIDTAMKSVE